MRFRVGMPISDEMQSSLMHLVNLTLFSATIRHISVS